MFALSMSASIVFFLAMFFRHFRFLFCCCVFFAGNCFSAIEVHKFTNEVDSIRYQSFIEEMRCPKCQNQNLAGSDSPIAKDLRNELVIMIQEGQSDKEIIDFMVNRYGDFILYRPRLKPSTILLWGAPILLLVVGFITLLVIVSNRRRLASIAVAPLSDDERARVDALLGSKSK